MKKSLLILCGLALAGHLYSQPLVRGTWEGIIAGKFKLLIHIDRNTLGNYFGVLDSPDQGVTGLPFSKIKFWADSLQAQLASAGIIYKARMEKDSSLAGTWYQGGGSVPLAMKKTSGLSGITEQKRPQTPKPPFPYRSEDLEYESANHQLHYGATLTLPASGGPFPTAVLITGSGQQDRDETLFDHKPFAIIADYLSRRGYAVLRVDDRGIGKSTGDLRKATSEDFAGDVLNSIRYLCSRPEIDSNRIGLIGHSEGGLIAPLVYSRDPRIAFIISLAGPGVTGAEILLRQQTDPYKKLVSPQAFDSLIVLTRQTLNDIRDAGTKADSLTLREVTQGYDNWKTRQPDTVLGSLGLKKITGKQYSLQAAAELQPWLKYFIATDPLVYWQRVQCPVLALNGEKDIQVYAEQNLPAIAAALQKGGNRQATAKIMPGLNHLFQHCKTCIVAEYGQLEESFDPEVLKLMGDWLEKNIPLKK